MPDAPVRVTQPISLRLTMAERDLLNAWAAYLTSTRARPVSRSEVVAELLLRAKLPGELSAAARQVRVKHQQVRTMLEG